VCIYPSADLHVALCILSALQKLSLTLYSKVRSTTPIGAKEPVMLKSWDIVVELSFGGIFEETRPLAQPLSMCGRLDGSATIPQDRQDRLVEISQRCCYPNVFAPLGLGRALADKWPIESSDVGPVSDGVLD
jgi:hypothetical protein